MSDASQRFPVQHIAKLANIPVTDEEVTKLSAEFAETLAVVEKLKQVDVSGIQPTFQVTGLENIGRDDSVDTNRMFTQAEALANAHQVYEGYFVVPQVIDAD